MTRTTRFATVLRAALAATVLAGTALSAGAASAGGYHGHGHGHRHGHGYGGYNAYCFYKKVKVPGYYGWHWERVLICR